MTYFQQVGAAMKAMEIARQNKATWYVGRPGCIPLYEAPNRAAAEAMLTKSMKRDGYAVFAAQ